MVPSSQLSDPIMNGTSPVSARIAKKLAPTQAGAKRLAQQYGDSLVCVRYRVVDRKNRRYTTVELVVDVQPLAVTAATEPVGIRIALANSSSATGSRMQAASGMRQHTSGDCRKTKSKRLD